MLTKPPYVTRTLLLILAFTLACNAVVAWVDSRARAAQRESFKHTLIGRDRYLIRNPIPGTPQQTAARILFSQKDITRVQAQACE